MERSSPGGRSLPELRLVTIFLSLIVVGMAVVYSLLRTGFGNDWEGIGRVTGFALLLVNFPLHWGMRGRALQEEYNWYWSPAAGGVLMIVLTSIAGWMPGGSVVGIGFSVLGFVAAVATFSVRGEASTDWKNLRFLAALACGLAWCTGVTWGAGFENPLYLENVALHGRQGSMDQFFHSALANMIQLFNVPSTGVDGVIRIPYHFGSHWLFARWASLVGLPSFDFYQVGYPIIVVALWFSALATMVLEVRRFRAYPAENAAFRGVVVAIVAASVIGSLPAPVTAALGFGIGPFFSESYAATMVIGFFLGGVVFAHFRAARQGGAGRFRSADILIAALVIPLGIVVLGIFKVSTFLFTIPALGYAVLRLRLYRKWHWVLSVILSIALAAVIMPTLQASTRFAFAPFGYLRFQMPVRWWPYWLSLHFFWSWVYVMVRLHQEKVTSLRMLRDALSRRSMLDVEIITLTAIGCTIPGLVLPLPIEAIYFTDQIRWVSVALILGDLWLLGKLSGFFARARSEGYFGFSTRQILALFVGLPLVISFVITLFSWPAKMVRMNLSTRKEISIASGAPLISLRERVKSGRIVELADAEMLSRGLANAPSQGLIVALRSLSQMPIEDRRHTAIYVPQTVKSFWGLYRSDYNCGWVAFVAPGLTGMQMIDGFPPQGCGSDPTFGFGLEAYSEAALQPRVALRTNEDLCERATRARVSTVLVLEPAAGPANETDWPREFRFRRLSCGDRL